jgi:hypothetical protein
MGPRLNPDVMDAVATEGSSRGFKESRSVTPAGKKRERRSQVEGEGERIE